MTSHGFDIYATDASVDVCRNPKPSAKSRFQGASIVVGSAILLLCVLVFLSGKHGRPSMWVELNSNPVSSSDFLVPMCIILAYIVFIGWLGIRWSLAAWPADDALHCDRSTFTFSRARWLDSQNHLDSHSFPLSSISDIRYGVIATAKNSTIYGLRFRLNGKKQKLLAGLEAPEAETILKALKSLGADVSDDPKLQNRIKSVREMRGEDTSWMDRSWMDHG
jgi:hypothetical protein